MHEQFTNVQDSNNTGKLAETAIKVFEDCLLPNGCLVAAPTHQEYYPRDAKSYMYSWPGRDGGFALASMILLGRDYYEELLSWLWERAEDVQTSDKEEYKGLIFRSYHPNGLLREHQFQPDQAGTLIWSIGFKREITKKEPTDIELTVSEALANGLERVWQVDKFSRPIEELWEERGSQPHEGIFTYSVAACATGMNTAAEILNNDEYKKTADEMRETIMKYCWSESEQTIPRRHGGVLGTDPIIDGSLSGLVWPFNVGFPQDHVRKTLKRIERDIVSDFGVHRYPDDRYEGADGHNHENDRAGAWPLLTFWLSIAWSELGEKEKAQKYFDMVFEKLEGKDYIPEQIFCCEAVPWTGISPLLWSHAKAIFAAWKLGLLDAV